MLNTLRQSLNLIKRESQKKIYFHIGGTVYRKKNWRLVGMERRSSDLEWMVVPETDQNRFLHCLQGVTLFHFIITYYIKNDNDLHFITIADAVCNRLPPTIGGQQISWMGEKLTRIETGEKKFIFLKNIRQNSRQTW